MSGAPKHQLLFVDDRPCSSLRPCSLNYALLNRVDISPILLRVEEELPSVDYLDTTAKIPTFYVQLQADLDLEIKRFGDWCNSNGLTPDKFCCISEPRQEYWQAFARRLGLTGLPPDVVRALRHKPTMKEWIRKLGLSTAEYIELECIEDLAYFGEANGYPIVVKPVDGWGALHTSIVRHETELSKYESEIRARPMMAESFLSECEYECCALIANGKVLDIFPSVMPAPPVEAAMGALNANISVAARQNLIPVPNLRETVQRLVTGFRLTYGYLHLEFYASTQGDHVYIGELALRYPGCEIAKNHGLALGFDIANATIDTYLGQVPNLIYTDRRCVGDLLLPYKAGRVRSLSDPDSLSQLPGVIEVHIGISVGQVLPSLPPASFNCSGWVFVEGTGPEEVEERMRAVKDAYVIETE